MRRALVVGIDDYPSAPLAGCVNDARAMSDLLARHEDGSPNFDVQTLTAPSSQVTKAVLRAKIDELLKKPADVALFYYSGHGTENNLGGYLVTQDAKAYDEGVPLTDLLTLINQATKVREVVVLLDSCHSGALGNVPAIDNDKANIREGVSILTASRSSEAAFETGGMGLFTSLVVGALEGGAADVLGQITVASTYAYVDESLGSWHQRPLFKSHVSTLISLRNTKPAVPYDILRKLPEWFPELDSEFMLDPSYEPLEKPAHKEHEEVFGHLQKCRAAKLVEPVGEDHMYFAAINSKNCRLTALGRHYWRLANDGRI